MRAIWNFAFIKLKNRKIDEPYCDKNLMMARRIFRGQLASYLNLLHYTRSCTVVTKFFDYANTTQLKTFF